MFNSRLDRVALGLIVTLVVLIAALVARGDQVGARVAAVSPAEGASGVSTRSRLSITFSEPMRISDVEARLTVRPPISGTLRWSGNTVFFDHREPLRADTTYTLTLAAGASSQRRRLVLADKTWTFQTGHPRVVYMAPASGVTDLYVSEADGSRLARLTNEPFGVFDFAVSPDGRRIAYSAGRDEQGVRDVIVINADGTGRERAVVCDNAACQYVSWSADGTRLAFERRVLIQGSIGKSPGPARIWLHDLPSKQSAPLLSDSQQLGSLPRWSPVGEQLAYYDTLNNVIAVIDAQSGDREQVDSLLGDSGTWAPDGRQLAFVELLPVDAARYSQILRVDLTQSLITPLLGITSTNDSNVAWSPIGDLVAFGRQLRDVPATGTFLPFGPQIHVVAPDGQGLRRLTNQPDFSYGGLAWSPDGQWISAVRINLTIQDPKPEVWLVRADGSRSVKLADDATLPAWLP